MTKIPYPTIPSPRNADSSIMSGMQNLRAYYTALAQQASNTGTPVTNEQCNITPGKVLTVEASWTLQNVNSQEAGNTIDLTKSISVVINGQKIKLAVLK
jgi:hypothetical protein